MTDKVVFTVPWFDIVEREVDGSSPYYVLRTTDYVTVLAITTEGSLLLVRQYRPAVTARTLEFPSGHVENGETPEAAARRELLEETGYEADTFEFLGTLTPDTGRLGNKLWCYFARDARLAHAGAVGEEDLELVRCGLEEFVCKIEDGSVNHALHLAVLLLAVVRGHIKDLPTGSLASPVTRR